VNDYGFEGWFRSFLRRNGSSDGSGAGFTNEAEASFRQVHDQLIVLTFHTIVFGQLMAKAADLDADSGIQAGIVVAWLVEGVDADGIFLELVGIAG
jgi:hypothetical protein